MVAKSGLVWVKAAALALVAAACGSTGGGADTTGGTGSPGCVPGATQACACVGGTMGVQSCNSDGRSFGSCECAASTSGSGGATSSSSSAMGTCGDGIIEPSDHCDTPGSEFYCKQDCVGASTSSGTGGACAGHIYYAGKFDAAPSVWANLPAAGGSTSLDAGNNQCKSLGVGADHVCDYEEVLAAAAAKEGGFAAIPAGTTAWVQRTTTAMVMGAASAPGPGGRCNDWTYMTNHISDGEYVTFDTVGTPTFHLDNDTIFDSAHPGVHTIPNDLQCGGTTRSILCCFQACM